MYKLHSKYFFMKLKTIQFESFRILKLRIRYTSILSYALVWTTCEINSVCRCIDDNKERKCIHIFHRLKRYKSTYIHRCIHQNTQIIQLEMGDGMNLLLAFFFFNNSILIFSAISYKSDQFYTTRTSQS